MRLSVAHSSGHPLDLPIVAAPGSVIDLQTAARLDLGGQLFLGYAPDRAQERRKGGIPPIGRAVLGIASGGRLVTDGLVVLGPGAHVSVGPSAEMRIGEGTNVTSNSSFFCKRLLEIGADCAISWDVLIMDNDAHWLSMEGEVRPMALPVRIGDHVWVGARATILKGTTIGDGAVIGAGAVVTKDVPPACVAAGNPAVVVHKNVEWN
jgi:acetyltransferase-like isoleucine patch superfamily enzyme